MWAALRYGLKVGVVDNRPKVLEDAIRFSDQVIGYYKDNNKFITSMGEAQMADLVNSLQDSLEIAFLQAMTDNKIWKSAKEHILKPGVSWTTSLLLEWLKLEARRRIPGFPNITPNIH